MTVEDDARVELSAEDEFLELAIKQKAYDATHINRPGHSGVIRHVRTPAGAEFYGLPIGAIITADIINKKNAEHSANGLKPPKGALTDGKVQAVHPAEVQTTHQIVTNQAGNGPKLPGVPGKGGGKGGAKGPGGLGGGKGGGKGPGAPGAAAAGDGEEPKVGFHPSTISGPNKFTVGSVEYSAPKDSRIYRPTSAPDALAYVVEPNGQLHAFNHNGELDIPPIVDKVLTEKFAESFKGDDKYLVDGFKSTAPDLASESKVGDVLSDASGPQFTQTANGDWQHNLLGSLHDHADLQKHVDSGDLHIGVGSNQTSTGKSLAEMDKPTLKKFLKKLPEGQHLEHTDKSGKVTQIVKGQDGTFQTAKGEPVGDSTLFLLRDKLAVVDDAHSPIKGAKKAAKDAKKVEKLKEELAKPLDGKGMKGEKPLAVIHDEVSPEKLGVPTAEKQADAPSAPKTHAEVKKDLGDKLEKGEISLKQHNDELAKHLDAQAKKDEPSVVPKSVKDAAAATAKDGGDPGSDNWTQDGPKKIKEEPKAPDDSAEKKAVQKTLAEKLAGYKAKKEAEAAAPKKEEPKPAEAEKKNPEPAAEAPKAEEPAKPKKFIDTLPDLETGHHVKYIKYEKAGGKENHHTVYEKTGADEYTPVDEHTGKLQPGDYGKKSYMGLRSMAAYKNAALVNHKTPEQAKAWKESKGVTEAATPPVEPPVEPPHASSPDFPEGHSFTNTQELRDLKPGHTVRVEYHAPSGSGAGNSMLEFKKHEDGSFRRTDMPGAKPLSHSDFSPWLNDKNHNVTAAEDSLGGHAGEVHYGDAVSEDWKKNAKPGDSIDEFGTGGGAPKVEHNWIRQHDGSWERADGNAVASDSSFGGMGTHWNVKVGPHHDATPTDHVEKEIADLAPAEAPKDELASVEPAAAFDASLKPGDKIPSKEWMVGAPANTEVNLHRNDGAVSHYVKQPGDDHMWKHDDGNLVKSHHLANSNALEKGKLTLHKHAEPAEDVPQFSDAATGQDEPKVELTPGKAYHPSDIEHAVVGDKLHYAGDDHGTKASYWEKTTHNTWENHDTHIKKSDLGLKLLLAGTAKDHELTWNKPEDKIEPQDAVEQAITDLQHEDNLATLHDKLDEPKLPAALEGFDKPEEVVSAPSSKPAAKVGETVTHDHASLKPGTIVTSSAVPGVKFKIVPGGYKTVGEPEDTPNPASEMHQAIGMGVIKVDSIPDHAHPTFHLPQYGELVMHEANVQKAIDALEGHPHFSPKYGLKSVPENDVAKHVDEFTAVATKEYPKPIKPKQALIMFLKDSIGQETKHEPHVASGSDLVSFKQKKADYAHGHQGTQGQLDFSKDDVQAAITALESSPSVQVKSILAKANNPLQVLDHHELIGFIKDKNEQKAKYLDFLKKKIGIDTADEPNVPAPHVEAAQEINTASDAAEAALKVGDEVTPEHLDGILQEPGHMVMVDQPDEDGFGHAFDGKTYTHEGGGSWKSHDGSLLGPSTMEHLAHSGSLTYQGKGDNGQHLVPDAPHAPVTPLGIEKPNPGDVVTHDQFEQLGKGDQLQHWSGGIFTHNGNHTFTGEGGQLWNEDEFHQGLESGDWTYLGKKELAPATPSVGDTLTHQQFAALQPGEQTQHSDGDIYTKLENGNHLHAVTGTEIEPQFFQGALDNSMIKYLGKQEAPAAKTVESIDELANDPVGQKYVYHGASKDTSLQKTADGKIENLTNGVQHPPQNLVNVVSSGKLEKVAEHPSTTPAYAENPAAPEVTNPEAPAAPASIHGLAPGKYGTKSGKAYMVVNGDGSGTLVSAQGVAKAADANKVKSVHDAGMNQFKGVIADDAYPKPGAAATVAAATPKKITSVEQLPNGIYYEGVAGSGNVFHVTGDSVKIHAQDGTITDKTVSYLKNRFLKGQLTDAWGNSILPKENYGNAKLFGSDTNTTSLSSLKGVLEGIPTDHEELLKHFSEVRTAWLVATGAHVHSTLPIDNLNLELQMHGVYADGGTLGTRAAMLFGDDNALNRIKTLQLTIDQMLKDVHVDEHPTNGAASLFSWNGHGHANLTPGMNAAHYTGSDNGMIVAAVKKAAEGFGNGSIIGQHSAKMTKGEKRAWLASYQAGNFHKMFQIESLAARRQGKSHLSGVLHPGHPNNPETHKVKWGAAVEGEVPAWETVEGEWTPLNMTASTDEVNNYLIKANMQNPHYLTKEERRNWMSWHRQGKKYLTDNLSLQAKGRKDSGESPLTELPSFVDNVEPAKSYTTYFESTPFPTTMGALASGDWFNDNIDSTPEMKEAWNKYVDEEYPHNATLAETLKEAPKTASHYAKQPFVTSYMQKKADEKAAQDLIPVYSHDTAFPVKSGVHAIHPLKDQWGTQYLFKPSPDGSAYRAEVEKLGTDLGQVFGFGSAESKIIQFEGKTGVLQRRLDAQDHLGHMDLPTLNDKQLGQIAQEHVLDWIINNDDSKGDNVLLLHNGSIVGIDKGRAFRKYGQWNGMSGMGGSQNMDSNAHVIYTKLYDGIRSGKLDKARADAIYLAALSRAQRMQKVPNAKLEGILADGLAHRDSYGGKQDISAAAVTKKFFDRKAALVDDINGMWSKIYEQAGLGDLPEAPKHPLGEEHSGVYDPRHHDVVLSTGVAGKSTFVGGNAIKGGFIHSFQVTDKQGDPQIQHDFALTEHHMATSTLPWLKNHEGATVSSPQAPDLPDHEQMFNRIVLGGRAVSKHTSTGEPLDQSKMDQFGFAKVDVNDDLAFIHDGNATGDQVHFPSGATVAGEHVPQYQLQLEHYNNLIGKVETALANNTKTVRSEFTKYEAPKYDASHEKIFNPMTNEKYQALAGGQYLHTANGVTKIVPKSQIAEEILNGHNGWQKTVTNTPAANPAYTVEKVKAEQENGVNDHGVLKLTGGHFQHGHAGTMYQVTLPTGEKLNITDHDETSTSWARQGKVRVIMPKTGDSAAITASWGRVEKVLHDMGIDFSDATPEHVEATYWKQMGHPIMHRDINKVASSSLGTAAVKKAMYAAIRADIQTRLNQYHIAPTGEAKFENLEQLSHTFPSVEEEAAFYRDIFKKHMGEKLVQDFLDSESHFPKYDHHDAKDLEKNTGMPYFHRLDVTQADLAGKDRLLGHKFYKGDSDAQPVGHSGVLMGTEGRMRMLGKWIKGMSSDGDQPLNSSHFVFTRWVSGTEANSNIYYSPQLARRIQSYSFPSDKWGNWSLMHESPVDPIHYFKQSTIGTGNETMIPDSIPLWQAHIMAFDTEQARQAMINEMKAKGISEIQGAPLEERIVLKQNFDQALAALKAKFGGKDL